MNIYRRNEWNARKPKTMSTQTAVREAFIHHSEDAHGNVYDTLTKQKAKMRDIQNFHMNGRGWSDIAYAFIIFQWVGTKNRRVEPRVFEGRLTRYVPAAQLNHNSNTLPICVVGNGSAEELYADTIKVIAALIKQYPNVRKVGGHRDVVATECPGNKFYAKVDDIARAANIHTYK